MEIKLARQGVYRSVQGEGHLSGIQMTFVRLGGCSIGCRQCDTNYVFYRSATAQDVVSEVVSVTPNRNVTEPWVWITGGEPTDQDIYPLIRGLRDAGLYVAVATAGHAPAPWPVDWLSVSPHDPDSWVQKFGNELKIVPGLNGVPLSRWTDVANHGEFWFRYVQPLGTSQHPTGKPEQIKQILEWIDDKPNWGITMQHHKLWGVD